MLGTIQATEAIKFITGAANCHERPAPL